MGLPGAINAIIPREKITDYLLSDTHPVGRHKARWFRRQGFLAREPERLETVLRECAQQGEIESEIEVDFGTKFVVVHSLVGPRGNPISLRTVWIVESGDPPRFVTAYPHD